MLPTLYWVEIPAAGRLATMARPRGGDWLADELVALHKAGVDVLVSLLTSEEAHELDLVAEEQAAQVAGLDFSSFPIPDFTVPKLDSTTVQFIEKVAIQVQHGQSVVVHCRMGIGRSSLIVASVLVVLGISAHDAFAQITTARRRPVPDTNEQREWVERFAAARGWLRAAPEDQAC